MRTATTRLRTLRQEVSPHTRAANWQGHPTRVARLLAAAGCVLVAPLVSRAAVVTAGISNGNDSNFETVGGVGTCDWVVHSNHNVAAGAPNCVLVGPGLVGLGPRTIAVFGGRVLGVFPFYNYYTPVVGALAVPKPIVRVRKASECIVAAGTDYAIGSAVFDPGPATAPVPSVLAAATVVLGPGSTGDAAGEARDPIMISPGSYTYAPQVTDLEISRDYADESAGLSMFAYDSRSDKPLWMAVVTLHPGDVMPAVDAVVDTSRLPGLSSGMLISAIQGALVPVGPTHFRAMAPFTLFNTNYSLSSMVSFDFGASAGANNPTVFSEVEPNESKGTATSALNLHSGDILTGTSTGSGPTAGLGGFDTFLIRTAELPPAIYQHELTLKDPSGNGNPHASSLRGLSQAGGVISALSDVSIQNFTHDPATNTNKQRWYGFGTPESLYYRVQGSATTTQEYRVEYSVGPVTPEDLGEFAPGSLTISTRNQGHTTDTELWVYDASFTAIPGYGNDNPSPAPATHPTGAELTRTFSPGRYYLAIAGNLFANSKSSNMVDEARRNGPVPDFDGPTVVNRVLAGDGPLDFMIGDGARTLVRPASVSRQGDAYWATFVVRATCVADVDDGSGTGVPDGGITIDDLIYYLAIFEAGDLAGDVDDGSGTGTRDGGVTIDDLLYFLFRFEMGC